MKAAPSGAAFLRRKFIFEAPGGFDFSENLWYHHKSRPKTQVRLPKKLPFVERVLLESSVFSKEEAKTQKNQKKVLQFS